jgi:hypothetical protein
MFVILVEYPCLLLGRQLLYGGKSIIETVRVVCNIQVSLPQRVIVFAVALHNCYRCCFEIFFKVPFGLSCRLINQANLYSVCPIETL